MNKINPKQIAGYFTVDNDSFDIRMCEIMEILIEHFSGKGEFTFKIRNKNYSLIVDQKR